MQFQHFAESLAAQFSLPPPASIERCEFLFDGLSVELAPHASGTDVAVKAVLGQLGTDDFQDRFEELLVANLFSNPTGEGVIGVEASGMAVITFHIPYRDTDPAYAAAMLSRFASHALHWHKKIKSHIAASAYRQGAALEEASHARV